MQHDQAGKWVVFSQDLMPIQPKVLMDGKATMWQGKAGRYGVIMFPPGDAQPVVTVVTLGKPDPEPDPEPDPKPDPEPDPDPPDTLGVVVVEDVAVRSQLPYGQVQAMTLPDIRDMADSFRLVDKDVEDPDGDTPGHLAPYLEAASKADLPHLMLHDEDGDIIWQGAVPETAEAMRDHLRKFQPAEPKKEPKVSRKPEPQKTRYVRRTRCGPLGRCYTTWEVAP